MKRVKKVLMSLLILTSIISCEKESSNEGFYANVQIDESSFKLIDKSGSIKAVTYFDSNPKNFAYGGIIYDEENFIEGTFPRSIYSFAVIFHNVPFNDLRVGRYEFYHTGKSDTVWQGVKVQWMEPDSWEDLISKYRLSEDYKICIENAENSGYSFSSEICEEYTKGYYHFFLSSCIEQYDSHFEITTIVNKEFEVWNPDCFPEEFLVEELIIEGRVKCLLQSRLDTNSIKSISADFRLQIPDYLNRQSCND